MILTSSSSPSNSPLLSILTFGNFIFPGTKGKQFTLKQYSPIPGTLKYVCLYPEKTKASFTSTVTCILFSDDVQFITLYRRVNSCPTFGFGGILINAKTSVFFLVNCGTIIVDSVKGISISLTTDDCCFPFHCITSNPISIFNFLMSIKVNSNK